MKPLAMMIAATATGVGKVAGLPFIDGLNSTGQLVITADKPKWRL